MRKKRRRDGRKNLDRPVSNSPGLFSIFRPRLPHSRTFDINMRICFWQSDLLLFGHGLRLLAICRLAWGSLTSLRWRMRELARAAIFPAPTLPRPHRQPLAARWSPGVGGYRGPPPCPLTQGDGAPLRGRGAERSGRLSRGTTRVAAGGCRRGGRGGSGGCRKKWRLLSGETQVVVEQKASRNVFRVSAVGSGGSWRRHSFPAGASHVGIQTLVDGRRSL